MISLLNLNGFGRGLVCSIKYSIASRLKLAIAAYLRMKRAMRHFLGRKTKQFERHDDVTAEVICQISDDIDRFKSSQQTNCYWTRAPSRVLFRWSTCIGATAQDTVNICDYTRLEIAAQELKIAEIEQVDIQILTQVLISCRNTFDMIMIHYYTK